MNASDLHIIHCDLDAFYAAVEQRDHPEFRDKPVIIGGDPNSRSVVSTCSYEARVFGVRSAMPTSRARILCPQGIFLPVNMPKYIEASHQVFGIFQDYTPLVEGLSIDEAFLDISGCERLFGTAQVIGQQIKDRVRNEVGLTISVGISINKFLAKLATELGKPDGLKVIQREEIIEVLSPLPIRYLWGAGQRTVETLNRMGIETIGQIQEMEPREMTRFGKSGQSLWLLAQGIDERIVEPGREMKSLGRETTFPEDVTDRERLNRVLLEFAGELGSRLRRYDLQARTVNLKLRYSSFKTLTRARTLAASTTSDMELYRVAIELLEQVNPAGPVRLIGLSVSGLVPAAEVAGEVTLFTEPDSKSSPVDEVMDAIKKKYGQDAITRATLLEQNQSE